MPITETTPFNFDELYSGVQQKFSDAGYDVAEGSNISQLTTAMAYLTSMLNINTAVNINETILPFATARNNVLTDARVMGYEIQHKQSFTYKLSLSLSGNANGTYIIPKYSEFTEGGKTFYYMGPQLELVNDVYIANPIQANDNLAAEITVIEGELLTHTNFPETLSTVTTLVENESGLTVPQSFIDLPFTDIENTGIECFVTYYDDFGILVVDEEWVQSTDFSSENTQTKFFRVDNIKSRTPRVYFEIGGVGTGVKLGSTVKFNVLKTSGVDGAISDFAAVKHNLVGVEITDVLIQSEGTDEETIQSIKENAPKFYNSANRAVTANDYISISNRQSSIEDSLVWGGEEELPKSPGHIWFSFLPSTLDRTYTSDAFNKQFKLNLDTYTDWDYTIAVDDTDAAFNAQYDEAAAYYSARYLEDSEIVSDQFDNSGNLVQPGIWDVLEEFKIPTLEYHNRHPIYLDFDYSLEILKYNVVTSKSDINASVFKTIDNFFTGVDDSFSVEQFGIDYFHSSLEKRIDINLTDASGFNNTVETRLMLSQKNVTEENADRNFRDVYVPLSVPSEKYFDASGALILDILPSIDTLNFIDYSDVNGITPIDKPNPAAIYTDWTDVESDIQLGTKHVNNALISAPIRIALAEQSVPADGGEIAVQLDKIKLYPDDPSTLDLGVPLYTNLTVKIISSDSTETLLVKGTDFDFDELVDDSVISLNNPLATGDVLDVKINAMCGTYTLFNSFKKYIIIQLYVNASTYDSGNDVTRVFQNPKSYLTTTDNLYDYSTDNFYVTTTGYTLTSLDQQNKLTGSIVKGISSNTYLGSPINMDLFRRNRYLDLNYNSPNFTLNKNVMPRLRSVSFKD